MFETNKIAPESYSIIPWGGVGWGGEIAARFFFWFWFFFFVLGWLGSFKNFGSNTTKFFSILTLLAWTIPKKGCFGPIIASNKKNKELNLVPVLPNPLLLLHEGIATVSLQFSDEKI